MDLKRYEKVTGHEALIKLLDGERIYNHKGNYWTKKGEGIFVNYEDENGEYESAIPVTRFVESDAEWYVKKPFDVRAEMLARPNEWVGAYKDGKGNWCKVKFNSRKMRAVESAILPGATVFLTGESELDCCIPIEDVPKEELA